VKKKTTPDKIRILKFHLPPVLWAALIFFGSSIHIQTPDLAGDWSDKLCHLIEYAVFGFLLTRSFAVSDKALLRRHCFFWAGIAGSFYGFTDEIHQSFLEYRSFEILDLLADISGSFLGAGLNLVCKRIYKDRKARENL
jgi:VanZ family protein